MISGFLISIIIFENTERGLFSFREFYFRRIRRIFPALILVLAFCLVFGWFFLLRDEYEQLGKHTAAGAGFVLNIVLRNESGYFDNFPDTKPLLHLWSLAVEEQYYLIWPVLAWFAHARRVRLLNLVAVLGVGSFALNVFISAHHGPFWRWPICANEKCRMAAPPTRSPWPDWVSLSDRCLR